MANSGMVWRKASGKNPGYWEKVSKSSTRTHKVGVNPHKEDGGKRKGKSMKRKPTEDLSGNVLQDALLRVRQIDSEAKLTVVARGTRVKMITYIDPSRKTK